jgi:hypothetical protein
LKKIRIAYKKRNGDIKQVKSLFYVNDQPSPTLELLIRFPGKTLSRVPKSSQNHKLWKSAELIIKKKKKIAEEGKKKG